MLRLVVAATHDLVDPLVPTARIHVDRPSCATTPRWYWEPCRVLGVVAGFQSTVKPDSGDTKTQGSGLGCV